MQQVKNNILRTLLYYDIFSHPLKNEEVFTFLPENSISKQVVYDVLDSFSKEDSNSFAEKDGYYYVKPNRGNITKRLAREAYSKKVWKAAWVVTHIIKRFPYVRAVMVTGSLSKNSSDKASDLDFMIITSPGRLWISRTLLTLFKKIFLLNSYKYFCLNYYITEDNLEIDVKNVFTATEIATIKGTYNSELMNRFIESNSWIKEHFPNYVLCDPNMHTAGCNVTNKRSILQAVSEAIIPSRVAEKLDVWMMNRTIAHWKKKYSYMDDTERNFRMLSTRSASKAHPESVHLLILNAYNTKLKQFNLQ